MGQKSSKLQVAEEYLKPRGLYQCSDVDVKKLRKLILDGKLAPCYCPSEVDGERCEELEECPICFMGYPALNRSQCCGKEICTECFLQVKLPSGARVGSLCPFCKAEFSVFFRGPRSLAEKEAVQAEEQLIMEATLRARQAQEKESEERAVKRLMEKFEKSEREREAAESAALRAAALQAAAEDYHAACRKPPAMQGAGSSAAAEAVGGGMFAVDLAEFIPPDVMSGSAVLDLDDAMLIQAIQASLRDQGAPASEQFDHFIGSPVQPAALAFSPGPLEPAWPSRSEGRDAASPRTSLPVPGPPSCEGQEEGGPPRQSLSDAAFWEEVALGPEVSPSPSAPSPQEDSWSKGFGASSSIQEARVSQAAAQTSPAWGRSLGKAGDMGSPMHTTVAHSQEGEAARTPSPYLSNRRRSRDGNQSGDCASNMPHQIPDAILGSDLFTVSADGRSPQRSAAQQPGRPGHSVAMNVMSTVSSTSMEQLLMSARDWDDLLATPKALDLLSSHNAATSSSLDMFATHNLHDLLATPTARVLAFPEAIAEAASAAVEGMQQRNSQQGLPDALSASDGGPPKPAEAMGIRGVVEEAGEDCMSAGIAAMAGPAGGGGNGAAHSSDAVAGMAEVGTGKQDFGKAMQSAGPEQVAQWRAATSGALPPRMAPSASAPALEAMDRNSDLAVTPTEEEACQRKGVMGSSLRDPSAAGAQHFELPSACKKAAVCIPEDEATMSGPAHNCDQPHGAPIVEWSEATSQAAPEEEQGGTAGGEPSESSHAPTKEDPVCSMGERSSTGSMDSSQQALLEEMETAEISDSSLAAILLRRTSDSDCSAASISPRLMPNPASQARMSRIADPVHDSNHDRHVDLSPDRCPGKSAVKARVPGDGSRFRGADEEALAFDSNGSNAEMPLLPGRGSACELQGVLSRNGSGQECEGLIAAVRVPSPSPSPQQKALPAPPKHLKALISSGESSPQGLRASQEASIRASTPFPPRVASPITPQGKALSFADLVAGKSRMGVGSARKSKAQARSPVLLTVGMMMVTQDPAVAVGPEDPAHQAKPADAAGTADLRQSSSELPIAGSSAHKKPSGESQPGGGGGTLLYRESCSSGGMHLSEDGGAVLLTNPDGSRQLVLLTNDQRKQVADAQAWKVDPPTMESYTALSTPEDLAVKQRIAAADEAMLTLYRRLQASQATGASSSVADAQPHISQNAMVSQGEDFMDRLRKADEAFAQALMRRDAETGAAAPSGAAERAAGASSHSQDTADASLTKLLDEEDAKLYRSA